MKKRFGRILTAAALLVLLAAVGGRAEVTSPLLLGNPSSLSAPFEAGEHLRYVVKWSPPAALFFLPDLKAGEIRLEVTRTQYEEHPAYTIKAWAESDGLLSRLAGVEIRDYFESTIDRESFKSYRFFKKQREGKRKRDVEVLFDYAKNRTVFRQVDLNEDPPRTVEKVFEGLPGPVCDVLSVFYVTRLRPLEPGEQFLIYLNEQNEKNRDLHIKVLKPEKLKTGLGRFQSFKISTVGGLFPGGGDFRIWYSSGRWRVPIRFEADHKLGKVYGEIIRMDTGSESRAVIRIG